MRWKRRRDTHSPSAADSVQSADEAATLGAVTLRVDGLEERVAAIEERLDRAWDVIEESASHADVLDVRVHGARVAAELAAVAVQLRAEIDAAGRPPPPPATAPVVDLVETPEGPAVDLRPTA